MSRYDACTGTPEHLAEATLCLDELSKDFKGELTVLDADIEECRELGCRTLTSEHVLRWELSSHACDSELGRLFDGALVSKDLVTAFIDGSGERRGTHTATFRWRSAAGVVHGRLQGMTNEGTHREPPFDPCQRCDERGVLEGRLCGTLVRATEPRLTGTQVVAAYRMRFDPTERGGEGAVTGTVEGVVLRPCGTGGDCVEYAAVGSDTNPRTTGGITVETRDLNGPTPTTTVVTWAAHTGLQLWHSATLSFAQPVSRVDLTLVHFASPATATAFDTGGAVVTAAAMTAGQQVPETLVLSGAGIASVVVDSPQDEVLMPKVCWRT